jgi:hypothetical protein
MPCVLGAAVDPVKFPKMLSAENVEAAKLSAGVVVAVATLVVNRGAKFPALKVDTPPAGPGGPFAPPFPMEQTTLSAIAASSVHVGVVVCNPVHLIIMAFPVVESDALGGPLITAPVSEHVVPPAVIVQVAGDPEPPPPLGGFVMD